MARWMLIAVLFAVGAVLVAKAERYREHSEDEEELEELHHELEDERDPRPFWFSRRRYSRRRRLSAKTKAVKYANCCPLSGYWTNELKSCMYLNHLSDGTLTGQYLSDVGNPGGVQPLYGKAGTGKPTTFGFAVSFQGGASTTAWSGLYQSCGEQDKLSTTWILSRMVNNCSDNWQAFHVGQDQFYRSAPCMII